MTLRFHPLQQLGEQFEHLAQTAAAHDANADGPRRRWSLSRLGRVRRTRGGLAVAVAALVTAAGAATAAVTLTSSSTHPVIAGKHALCPEGFDYLANTATKTVYPPNYPASSLPEGSQTTCFASDAAAHKAGYAYAPTPRGYRKLGSLYLKPAPAQVRKICDAAAVSTHRVIYCPTVLPAPWSRGPSAMVECPTAACPADKLLNLSGGFTTVGTSTESPGSGSLEMWAAPESEAARQPYLIGCWAGFGPSRVSTPAPMSRGRFRGHPAAWYRCNIAPIVGDPPDTAFEWRIGKWTYGVAANGTSALTRQLVRYITAHMTTIQPPEH